MAALNLHLRFETSLCYKQQVVYVLDQVVAFEEELLVRIKQQGLNVKPQILVVSTKFSSKFFYYLWH